MSGKLNNMLTYTRPDHPCSATSFKLISMSKKGRFVSEFQIWK